MSWKVLALDGAIAQGQSPLLTLAFEGGQPEAQEGLSIGSIPGIAMSRNTKAQLSITVVGALSQSNPFASAFLISHNGSSLAGATADHYWPLAVTTQAVAHAIGLDVHVPVRC